MQREAAAGLSCLLGDKELTQWVHTTTAPRPPAPLRLCSALLGDKALLAMMRKKGEKR